MAMVDHASQSKLVAVRDREHRHCFVCDPVNPAGLGLEFRVRDDGTVIADFSGGQAFHGYPYRLHGGLTSSLLDGAMTNCLFARGVVAVTAELSVRFHYPALSDRQASVKAWIERSRPPLHLMRAELSQDGRVLATAMGKFMERTGGGNPDRERSSGAARGSNGSGAGHELA
jgi:acyl-coenzyme A thioesterase PaaI-like protein